MARVENEVDCGQEWRSGGQLRSSPEALASWEGLRVYSDLGKPFGSSLTEWPQVGY